MTFTLQESAGGLSHLLMGWQRRLLGRPSDFYLRRLEIPSALGDTVRITRNSGDKLCCHWCGYEVARLETSQGWLIETCSASARSFLSSCKLRSWLRALADSGSQAQLPPPGKLETERLASHLPS